MKIFNRAVMHSGLKEEGNLAEAIQNLMPLTAVLNDCFPSNTISSDEQDLSLPISKALLLFMFHLHCAHNLLASSGK